MPSKLNGGSEHICPLLLRGAISPDNVPALLDKGNLSYVWGAGVMPAGLN